jgi:iron(III) transport system permease protein
MMGMVHRPTRPPLVLLAGGVVASVGVLVPIVYIAVRATDRGWGAFRDTLWRGRTFDLLWRSLELGIVVTIASAILGIGGAWLVSSTDLPGRRFWQVALALPLALPSYIAAWAWIGWRPELAGFRGAAIVLTTISYPYVYLPVLGALRSADPGLAEVARSSGRRPLDVFLTVTLRQVRIAATGGSILVMLYVLSEFGAVSIMRYQTLTQVIYSSYRASFDRTPAAVLGCVLVAVAIIPLWLVVRISASERVARVGTGVTRQATPIPLGPWRWPMFAAVGGLVGISLGVPAWNLARWMNRGTSSTPWTEVFDAALTTLWVGVITAAVTVLIALPLGLLSARYPGRFSRGVTTIAYAGHALPGIVVALSLVFFGIRYAEPIYQRLPMLIAAYVVIFLSLAIGAIHGSIAQAPPMLDEVARSSGRSMIGTWFAVTLRLAAPGIGMSAALVCIATMKELPATLLLRPIGTETLATRLWSKTDAVSYAAAAPYAIALVVTASIPTALLTYATLRRSR